MERESMRKTQGRDSNQDHVDHACVCASVSRLGQCAWAEEWETAMSSSRRAIIIINIVSNHKLSVCIRVFVYRSQPLNMNADLP